MPKRLFDSIVGIDEVARCPAIGSMVMAGVGVPYDFDFKRFEELGVMDSKLLSAEKITYIARQIFAMNGVLAKYRKISGAIISVCENLNTLEAQYASILIKAFRCHTRVKEVYIDNCDITTEKYMGRLKRFITLNEESTKYIVEHKADENYLVVSAASIIAKYISNKEYEDLRSKYDIGSGNPGDKKTKEFIRQSIIEQKDYSFIRKNWATYKRILSELKKSNQKDYIGKPNPKTIQKRIDELYRKGTEESILEAQGLQNKYHDTLEHGGE